MSINISTLTRYVQKLKNNKPGFVADDVDIVALHKSIVLDVAEELLETRQNLESYGCRYCGKRSVLCSKCTGFEFSEKALENDVERLTALTKLKAETSEDILLYSEIIEEALEKDVSLEKEDLIDLQKLLKRLFGENFDAEYAKYKEVSPSFLTR
jgi:hypothetical protein